MRGSCDRTFKHSDVAPIGEGRFRPQPRQRSTLSAAFPPDFEHVGQTRSNTASPTLTRSPAIPFNLGSPRSAPATPVISQSPHRMSLLSQSVGASSTPPSHSSIINTALYKTELCRSYLETGTCRYGAKCQFAHGEHELRPVQRHPRYKTEVCQTFQLYGTCKYGSRCRFIHPHTAESALSNETATPVAFNFAEPENDEDDRLPVFQQLSQH